MPRWNGTRLHYGAADSGAAVAYLHGATTLAAAYISARGATRIDPVQALRDE